MRLFIFVLVYSYVNCCTLAIDMFAKKIVKFMCISNLLEHIVNIIKNFMVAHSKLIRNNNYME